MPSITIPMEVPDSVLQSLEKISWILLFVKLSYLNSLLVFGDRESFKVLFFKNEKSLRKKR